MQQKLNILRIYKYETLKLIININVLEKCKI